MKHAKVDSRIRTLKWISMGPTSPKGRERRYALCGSHVVDKGDAPEPVIFSRPGVDLVLKGWMRVHRVDPESGSVGEIFLSPNGQACVDIVATFDEYQDRVRSAGIRSSS